MLDVIDPATLITLDCNKLIRMMIIAGMKLTRPFLTFWGFEPFDYFSRIPLLRAIRPTGRIRRAIP